MDDSLPPVGEAGYHDGDILIINDLKSLEIVYGRNEGEGVSGRSGLTGQGPVRMDMIAMIACTEGSLEVVINAKTLRAQEGDLLFLPPNVMIDGYEASADFDALIICLSYSALQRMLHVNKAIWDMVTALTNNPVYHPDEETMELLLSYHSMMVTQIKRKGNPYRQEVMHSLFQAFFYDICAVLIPEGVSEKDMNLRQGDVLVRRFMKLLGETLGRERSVSYYADKLSVTPKYLSTACRKSTGKTALEWIHEYTINIIVQELTYSDKSIKEIGGALNFPNLSFFGKFVKKHLGVSPTEYRKTHSGIKDTVRE